jgi:cytochrome c551
MISARRPFLPLLPILVATALLAVGCGSDDDSGSGGSGSSGGGGETSEAESLFVGSCGSCHELSAAGTDGSVGPSLDDTSLDAAAIEAQIERGGGAMPAGILEGEQAAMVAEYVAGAAGS